MNNTISILKQEHSSYNPYFFNGLQIDRIRFFKEGKVIGSVKWFGNNNEYPELHLPFIITKKRKKDLTLPHGFILKEKALYSNDKVYNLYAPLDAFEHKISKGIESKWGNTQIKRYDEVTFTCLGINQERYLDENDRLRRRLSELKSHNIKFECNLEFILTAHGKKCKRISNAIQEKCNIKLSEYDTDNLMKHFNITQKRG